MLKQEQVEEPAARVRVTPEELAAAIARIEARQDTDQRRADGTIPIGEAVQQLGLEATPEEVLAEVQAGRRQAVPRKRRMPLGRRLALSLGLTGILLGAALGGNDLWQMRRQAAAQASAGSYVLPVLLDPNLLVSTASGKLVNLSAVKDGQPVHCDMSGVDGRVVFTQWTPNSATQNPWTLIKHDGQVYVRGWTYRTTPGVTQKNGFAVRVQSQPETDGMDVSARSRPNWVIPVTLPLQDLAAVPKNGVWFHAVGVHLDQHANEKWRP